MRFSARKIIYLSLFVPQLSFAQKENASLERIDQMLSSKAKSVTEILQDPAYMKLHSLTPFREIIKNTSNH